MENWKFMLLLWYVIRFCYLVFYILLVDVGCCCEVYRKVGFWLEMLWVVCFNLRWYLFVWLCMVCGLWYEGEI